MAELLSRREFQPGPRPDEIAAHRFSLTFLGAHPGEVRRSLLELGAALDRTRRALTRESLEVSALGKALEPAGREIEELRAELIAARAELAAYRNRRFAVDGQFLAAEESSRIGAAKARADEIAAAAAHTAKATMQAARTTALDVLRSARTAAQVVRRSADVGASAEACAGARPPVGRRLSALVALFQELALELHAARAGRDRGGAATARRLRGTRDAVRAILARISGLSPALGYSVPSERSDGQVHSRRARGC
jgi:hypothetical protein